MRRVSTLDLVPFWVGKGRVPLAEAGPSCSGTSSRPSPSLLPPPSCLLPAPVSVTHRQRQVGTAMAAVLIWISLLLGKLGSSSGERPRLRGVRSSSGEGLGVGVRQGLEGLWGVNSTADGALGNWGWELGYGGLAGNSEGQGVLG